MTEAQDRWSLLVISPLPDEVHSDLREHFDVSTRIFEGAPDPGELAKAMEGKQALLTAVGASLPANVISALPSSVKAIGTYSVGYNHIDIEAAKAKNIAVFYTPDVLSDAVAEVAMLHMLGAARRATESIDLIRSKRWTGWTAKQLNGVELLHKRLGIFGMGRIGRAIATRARGFGMFIHYCNRSRLTPDLEQGAIYHAAPERLLEHADVLVLAGPSSPETRGFLNETRINHLPAGAIVVNISRGELVVDDALIAALKSGQVRAAGLDVFNNEPNLDSRYYDLPNVFMLPHIGSSTIETRRRMGLILIEGILAYRQGVQPENLLTPSAH